MNSPAQPELVTAPLAGCPASTAPHSRNSRLHHWPAALRQQPRTAGTPDCTTGRLSCVNSPAQPELLTAPLAGCTASTAPHRRNYWLHHWPAILRQQPRTAETADWTTGRLYCVNSPRQPELLTAPLAGCTASTAPHSQNCWLQQWPAILSNIPAQQEQLTATVPGCTESTAPHSRNSWLRSGRLYCVNSPTQQEQLTATVAGARSLYG